MDFNLIYNKEVTEEEDILTPEDQMQQTKDTEPCTESIQPNEQHERLYSDNQIGQRLQFPLRKTYKDDRAPHVGWANHLSRKIICHSCYGKEHISHHVRWHYTTRQVVTDCDALTADGKATLQDTVYKNDKANLAITENNIYETDTKKTV